MLIDIKTSMTSILYISCTHNMPYAQFAAARKLELAEYFKKCKL